MERGRGTKGGGLRRMGEGEVCVMALWNGSPWD